MKKINLNESLWVEKYRPQIIEDCILPQSIKNTLSEIVKSRDIPNMLLVGKSGCGKSASAISMCKAMGLDYIFINGSSENGVDILRNKITQFSSTVSFGGGVKVVIIDEACGLTSAFQMALKSSIETFALNTRFIFTANFQGKILDAIQSRCTIIDFNPSKKDIVSLAQQFMKRMKFILKTENIKCADDKILVELILKFAPDWRRVLGECQCYSVSGEITSDILVGSSDENLGELITYLKTKDFGKMRSWVATNSSLDSTVVYHKIYDALSEHVEASSIPSAVLILAEYSFKSQNTVDKELQLVAACTEIMGSINWKH